MKLKVNNVLIDPIRVGDRFEFRFDAPEDLQYVTITKDNFMGDLELNEIQLEQSTLSTSFVEPMESETVASGIFKSVQGITYEITDPDSDTWASIRQTVDGSITTYHNGTLQSTIAHTIEDIIFGIRDIAKGDEASFNLRLEGIQQTVKNEMYQSIQTNLAHFVGLQLTDIEGNINEIQSTVNGTVQSISDVEGNLNQLQSTVNGTIQDISNLEGDYNSISDTVNSHSQIIGTNGGNLAQLVLSSELFQTSVINEINNTKSSITQLSNYINLRVNGSQITIGGNNITIDAKSIYLGSSTQIADGIITNRMISSTAEIDAAKITNLTVSNAQIVSLDVSKLSGNKANFIIANFNSGVNALTLSGTGLRSTGASYSYFLDSLGVSYYSGTSEVGVMRAYYSGTGGYQGRTRGIAILAKPGYEIHIGYGLGGSGGGTYTPAIAVDGTTGNIYMNNIYPSRSTSHGIQFVSGSIDQYQGWHIRHTNSNRAGIFFSNGGHVYIRRSDGTYMNLSTRNI